MHFLFILYITILARLTTASFISEKRRLLIPFFSKFDFDALLIGGGVPWRGVDPAGPPPNTGIVRHYDFVISRGEISPGGVNKSAILINNQFPGPLIEANWGDTIEVRVTNRLNPSEGDGATIHWHGLTQVKSPYYDGVPGVSQCPIAPGFSFTYTFQADQYGTSWYHSHYSAQYSDGCYGPMIIHGPPQSGVEYDLDLGTVLLSDHTHTNYNQVLEDFFSVPLKFPNIDNNLWNGNGLPSDCLPSSNQTQCNPYKDVPRYRFEAGKTYRLRLINSGAAGNQKFTIDNHEMTVIANDFVPVQPYKTKVVTLGIGQRTDILIKASSHDTDAVYMRSDIDTDCLNLTISNPHALAAVYYSRADTAILPTSTATPWLSNHCANDPLNQTVPFYAQQPPLPSLSQRQNLLIELGLNASGQFVSLVDNSSYRANYNHPVLLLTKLGNTSYPDSPEWNVYDFGDSDSVLLVVTSHFDTQHPMHLHGHNFWVLNEGVGEWDGTVINPSNPQRRDTHILQPGSVDRPYFVVLQWKQDNPGIWPFHCHTSLHISNGLGALFMERPKDVQSFNFPSASAQSCRNWSIFTGTHIPDQIDSGL